MVAATYPRCESPDDANEWQGFAAIVAECGDLFPADEALDALARLGAFGIDESEPPAILLETIAEFRAGSLPTPELSPAQWRKAETLVLTLAELVHFQRVAEAEGL